MKEHSNDCNLAGFSLVELSIVLVILGLLVGGILSGQSLIRASELRSVSTEYQKYATAIGTFRDKYFGLPGDLSNATSIWGATNNGNGDGNGTVNLTATANTNEASLFWIHLSSANMIEGSYTNVAGASTTDCGTMTPGTNNPKAKISFGGWNALGLGTVAQSDQYYYDASYGNALVLSGGTTCGTTGVNPTGILKSEEAWNIDTKIDDGKPATGNVLTFEAQGNAAAGQGCGNASPTGGASLASSTYDLTNTSKTACSLVFKTGY